MKSQIQHQKYQLPLERKPRPSLYPSLKTNRHRQPERPPCNKVREQKYHSSSVPPRLLRLKPFSLPDKLKHQQIQHWLPPVSKSNGHSKMSASISRSASLPRWL